jgi:hypothetical protein
MKRSIWNRWLPTMQRPIKTGFTKQKNNEFRFVSLESVDSGVTALVAMGGIEMIISIRRHYGVIVFQ